MSDLHASAAYRRRVAVALCIRALEQARANAAAKSNERRAMKVELRINGVSRTADVEPRKTLLDALRENFLLNGTHAGCEHGVCGACTVLVDGEPVRSCLMFAVQADGYEITTIEGLAPAPGELSVIQDAFCETHGLQCGYCTPGMILSAHALLQHNADADARGYRRGDLRQYLPLHRLRPDHRGGAVRRRRVCASPIRRVRRALADKPVAEAK